MNKKLLKLLVKNSQQKILDFLKNVKHFDDSDIKIVKDIEYKGGKLNKLDLYFDPKFNNQPVLFNIHGGGFLLGSKEINKDYCVFMAKQGFFVITIDYPLIPDVDVFEIFKDLIIGINKGMEEAKEYKADLKNVFLSGDSAGAYLSLYIGAMANNEEMKVACNIKEDIPHFNSLILTSGMFYTLNFDQIGMCLKANIYGKNFVKHPFYKYMKPDSKEILDSLPPVFLISGKGDYLKKYNKKFKKALIKNNNIFGEFYSNSIKDSEHAYASVIANSKVSIEANLESIDFIKNYLK